MVEASYAGDLSSAVGAAFAELDATPRSSRKGVYGLVFVPKVILLDAADPLPAYSNQRRCVMGDKSPKSKERQKKQDAAQKSQQKADALAKANPPPTTPSKRGK